MADKKTRGLLFVIAGAAFEVVAIILFVTRAVAPVIAISLLVVGSALFVIGMATLRRDREDHALKRPVKTV